jgi:hypothetical protein
VQFLGDEKRFHTGWTRSGHAQPLLDNLLPMRPRTYARYRDMNSPPG